MWIDILRMNNELNKMIAEQDEEIKKMNSQRDTNERKTIADFALFIFNYLDVMHSICGDYNKTILCVPKEITDEAYPLCGYDYEFRVRANGNARIWFDGNKANGNGAVCLMDLHDLEVDRNGIVYGGDKESISELAKVFRVFLKHKEELDRSFTKQMVHALNTKAKEANKRYEEAEKLLKESCCED